MLAPGRNARKLLDTAEEAIVEDCTKRLGEVLGAARKDGLRVGEKGWAGSGCDYGTTSDKRRRKIRNQEIESKIPRGFGPLGAIPQPRSVCVSE